MDKKTLVITEYRVIAKEMNHIAKEMMLVASRLISISSYCDRKMSEQESSYIKEWIYEVMDTLDNSFRSRVSEISAFSFIYNKPYDYWKDFKFDNIKDALYEFERAASTFGEMKLSIRPNRTYPTLTLEEEVQHNLKTLEKKVNHGKTESTPGIETDNDSTAKNLQ